MLALQENISWEAKAGADALKISLTYAAKLSTGARYVELMIMVLLEALGLMTAIHSAGTSHDHHQTPSRPS